MHHKVTFLKLTWSWQKDPRSFAKCLLMGAFCLASLPYQYPFHIDQITSRSPFYNPLDDRNDKTPMADLQSWRTFEIVAIYVHCYFWVGPAPEIDATEQLIQKVAPIMIWLMGICICIYISIYTYIWIYILVISWSRKWHQSRSDWWVFQGAPPFANW